MGDSLSELRKQVTDLISRPGGYSSISDLTRHALREWAKWRLSVDHAYPPSDAVAAFKELIGGHVYCSKPPRGVQVQGLLVAAVDRAMQVGIEMGYGQQINVVQVVYMTGVTHQGRGGVTQKDVAKALGLSLETLAQYRRIGEAWIGAKMSGD